MAEITWDEFFKQPEILEGIVSDVIVPDNYFSAFLGIQVDSAPERVIYDGQVNWDVYNLPRTLATGRNVKDGYATKTPKGVEARNASIARFAQKTEFFDNDFLKMRPMGQPWNGVVTSDMRNWITREMQAHRVEFDQAFEFMVCRLLQGGFGFSLENNTRNWILCEKGAGDYDVDTGMPATHINQLDLLGASGADIIDAPWDAAGTSIVTQLTNLDVACTIKGLPVIREIHGPAEMKSWLLGNTELRALAGTSVRPFDTLEETLTVNTPTGQKTIKRSYMRMVGLPHHKFFINYDNFVLGGTDRKTTDEETDPANVTRAIPATKAMFLPEAEYLRKNISKIDGAEYVATDLIGGKAIMEGFKTFQHKLIGEQPGWVGKMQYHGLPILKVNKWTMFPTLDF